jgi:hypothetical protein
MAFNHVVVGSIPTDGVCVFSRKMCFRIYLYQILTKKRRQIK